VPAAVAALVRAADADGGRVPVACGPPVDGEAQAGSLTATFQINGKLAINGTLLMRRIREAAAKLGVPVAVVLRAEPEQRRCRLWLARPGAKGKDLEAGVLPDGVTQLSEAALASGVWEPAGAGADTLAGSLDAIFAKTSSANAVHLPLVPATLIPPALLSARWMAAALGAPAAGEPEPSDNVRISLTSDGHMEVSGAQLVRLLGAAHAAAAGAPLAVVLRAEL